MKNGEETPRNRLRKRLGSVTEAPWHGFFSRKQFFSPIPRDFLIPEGWTPSFCPLSPIYRRKEGGGCRPAHLGELGCFHQKPPPIFGNFRKAQVGLGSTCTLFSTKYTPFCVFFLIDFFLKCCETLQITQRYLFSFQNVAKLYGLRNDACLWLSECCETLRITQQCLCWGSRREQTKFENQSQVLLDKIRVWQWGTMFPLGKMLRKGVFRHYPTPTYQTPLNMF